MRRQDRPRTWAIDLDRWRDKVQDRINQLIRESGLALFDQVQVGGEFSPGTPMVTGHARAGWQFAHGLPSGDAATSPETAREAAVAFLQDVKPGQPLVLGNTVPYVRRLEFGSSDQAPQGMTRLAATAADKIIGDIAEKIARGQT